MRDKASKGRRTRAYPAVTTSALRGISPQTPLITKEIELRSLEALFTSTPASDTEGRDSIYNEIVRMTGGYSPALPTPQISPLHDADGMPIA